MSDKREPALLSADNIETLVSAVARIGAAEIVRSGAAYADTASFWDWMNQAYSGVANRPGGWTEFMRAHPQSAKILFTGKVQEWDWARDFRHQLTNIGKSARPVAESTARHDVIVRDLISGTVEHVESKYASTRASAQSSLKNALRKPNIDRIVGTPEVIELAREQGLDRKFLLEEYRNAEDGASAAEQRMSSAKASSSGVTLRGVGAQIGRGALVGAVVSITPSIIGNYTAYRRGEIDAARFRDAVLKDGAKGAIKGAIFGGVNVGVQSAAIVTGIGAPLTIPVLVLFGVALDHVVDPAFGHGSYKKSLDSLNYASDLARLHVEYAQACIRAYEDILPFVSRLNDLEYALQIEDERAAALGAELRPLLDALPMSNRNGR